MKRFLLLFLAFLSSAAFAQQYPARPIRLVVPLSPGGFADTPARMLAARLSEQLGKHVFVENKPGAGGSIGWDYAAKSAPDGYTLVITGTTKLIGAHLYKNLTYDVFKDFTHIRMMASGPYVLAGHSFGGLYVLTFADRYPDEVAGMVLIDSTAPAKPTTPPAEPMGS